MKRQSLKQNWDIATAQIRAMATQKAQELLAHGKRDPGQGTTEYAILVGVLVVIAIIAIIAFRPKIQELWDAIVSGLQGL